MEAIMPANCILNFKFEIEMKCLSFLKHDPLVATASTTIPVGFYAKVFCLHMYKCSMHGPDTATNLKRNRVRNGRGEFGK